MKKRNSIGQFIIVLLGVSFLPFHATKGDVKAGEEWVDVPIVVNIINQSNAKQVDQAIEKANELLEQAHIRLVVKRINEDVEVGNNDNLLTENEGRKAQRIGQRELADIVGPGKGIKITFADNVWTEEPNNIGWAVHRNPVVLIETDKDANNMGITIAHEIIHALTVSGHSRDPNDLMYESVDNGGHLRDSDIDEVFPNAKRRGKSYVVAPEVLPDDSAAVSPGYNSNVVMRGATLDECGDAVGHGSNSSTVSLEYADLGEVTLYCDRPFDPNSYLLFEFQFCGSWQDNGFNNRLITVEIGEKIVDIEIGGFTGDRAVLYDPIADSYFDLEPPSLYQNQRFEGPDSLIESHSIQVQVPIELVQLNLASAQPITIAGNSITYDFSGGLSQPPLEINDDFEPFNLALDIPCLCPGLIFARQDNILEIFGCGLKGDVEIEINGQKIGTTSVNGDGKFVYTTELVEGLLGKTNSVLAREIDDSGPSGSSYAHGFFKILPNNCPDDPLVTSDFDLDQDGDVDYDDLLIYEYCFIRSRLNEN